MAFYVIAIVIEWIIKYFIEAEKYYIWVIEFVPRPTWLLRKT